MPKKQTQDELIAEVHKTIAEESAKVSERLVATLDSMNPKPSAAAVQVAASVLAAKATEILRIDSKGAMTNEMGIDSVASIMKDFLARDTS